MFFSVRSTHPTSILHPLLRLHKHQRAVGIFGHQDHALRLDAHHFAGGEVNQDAHLLSDHFLGRILLGDAAQYGALVNTGVQRQFEQLLRLLDLFGG